MKKMGYNVSDITYFLITRENNLLKVKIGFRSNSRIYNIGGFERYLKCIGVRNINSITFSILEINSSNKNDLLLLFKVMLENNDFPPEYSDLLDQIVNEIIELP